VTLVSYSVLQHLRRAGLRPTVARIAILQVVQADPAPGIGADEAYLRLLQRGTRTSLSTVYRTLAQLQAAGLLQSAPAPVSAPGPALVPQGALPPGRLRCVYRWIEGPDGCR